MEDFFQPIHLLILCVVVLFIIVPFWMIFKKAGFPPAISLLMFIPFVGVLVLYIVAFSEWKVVPRQTSAAPIPPYPPQI
jgi:hypothetical protein